jgi:hypothetical protein
VNTQDQQAWDRWVAHFRADAVSKIAESAFTVSLVPDGATPGDRFDVKFAAELGAAIMLDKPIVAVCLPGRGAPAGLRRIAHAVIEMDSDIDTEAGQLELHRKLGPLLAEFGSAR